MSTAERIFKEAQKLPDTLAQEVLDFIGYIEIKHGLRDRLTEELKQAGKSNWGQVLYLVSRNRPCATCGTTRTTRFGMTCKPGDLV